MMLLNSTNKTLTLIQTNLTSEAAKIKAHYDSLTYDTVFNRLVSYWHNKTLI